MIYVNETKRLALQKLLQAQSNVCRERYILQLQFTTFCCYKFSVGRLLRTIAKFEVIIRYNNINKAETAVT